MPMPPAFTRRLGASLADDGEPNSRPIIAILAAAVVAEAVLAALRAGTLLYIAAALLGLVTVIVVDLSQRRRAGQRVGRALLLELVVVALFFWFIPLSLALGPAVLPSVLALLVFVGRRQAGPAAAAAAVAVAGVALRFVLSAGVVPYPVFVVVVTGAALAALAAAVRAFPRVARADATDATR